MASNSPKRKPLRKSVPIPPDRIEWLFHKNAVPEEELVGCVCWEYMREVRPTDQGPKGLSEYAMDLLIGYRSNPERRKFSDSFDAVPLGVLVYLAEHPGLALPLPAWQNLDADLRQELKRPMLRAWSPLVKLDVSATTLTTWSLKIPDQGTVSNPKPWSELARELYAFGVANDARYHSTDGAQSPSIDAPEIPRAGEFADAPLPSHDPRFWLAAYAANGFATPIPLLVNWAECDTDEIIEALIEWVHEIKPKFAPAQREAGTKFNDLRGHLRDLGAARIMNVMTEDEFKDLDEEYDLLRRSEGIEAKTNKLPNLDLSKMRKAAVNYFRKRFALDPAQIPQSWRARRPRGASRY